MDENNQGPIQEFGVKPEQTVNNQAQQPVNSQPVQNTQYQTTQSVPAKKVNPLCMASFICALVGLLVAGLPLGIAAIITGGIGLSKYNEQNESGKWMAIVGIVLGAIDIVAVIIFVSTMSTTMNTFKRFY